MTGERARPHETTQGWQGDTRAASALRPTASPGTPAAAARGSAPPVEKQPHAAGASEAGFARTNADAGVKAHTAQAPDANAAASNAQRPLGTGFMGDPGLGGQHDDPQPYDNDFRKDYDAHYANTGASFDEYRRAYCTAPRSDATSGIAGPTGRAWKRMRARTGSRDIRKADGSASRRP